MIETVGVIGAGTMGHGIALAFALHGVDVRLYDVAEEPLKRAVAHIGEALQTMVEEDYVAAERVEPTLSRIHATADLAFAVADRDYVLEAAPEQLSLKHDLLGRLDGLMRPEAILGSNASSLALEAMAEPCRRRARPGSWSAIGSTPAILIPLVELSYFGNTSESVFDEVAELYRRIGKQTIKVLKDVPGLVANRLGQGIAREAFSLFERGVADPADIDKALKFGPAFRYATTGQLEVADFGGLDIWRIVGDNLLKDMDNSTEANAILHAAVKEGRLGVKSGRESSTIRPKRSRKPSASSIAASSASSRLRPFTSEDRERHKGRDEFWSMRAQDPQPGLRPTFPQRGGPAAAPRRHREAAKRPGEGLRRGAICKALAGR